MGFGENRSKRALEATNNNAEAAMNWLFDRNDDLSLDAPIENKKSSSSSSS